MVRVRISLSKVTVLHRCPTIGEHAFILFLFILTLFISFSFSLSSNEGQAYTSEVGALVLTEGGIGGKLLSPFLTSLIFCTVSITLGDKYTCIRFVSPGPQIPVPDPFVTPNMKAFVIIRKFLF